ncbi:hypothetical protein GCM10007905_31130 [Mixta theicola]|nr:hypothetical protein GCM10007905_31130 [Mixta theicola]
MKAGFIEITKTEGDNRIAVNPLPDRQHQQHNQYGHDNDAEIAGKVKYVNERNNNPRQQYRCGALRG